MLHSLENIFDSSVCFFISDAILSTMFVLSVPRLVAPLISMSNCVYDKEDKALTKSKGLRTASKKVENSAGADLFLYYIFL